MKAAVIEALGRAPVYAEFPEPAAHDDAVVATVEAAALTNLTRGLVAGSHYGSSGLALPSVAGVDGVARLSDGRRVYTGAVSPYGMMAERALIDPRGAVDVPDGVDAVTAAAAPNPGLSAWMSLHHAAQIQPDHHVLVVGATGVTGALAVQLAKMEFGVQRVVAVGRDADRLQWLRTVGADDTIRLGHDDLGARVGDAHRDRPFDVVLDYLWGEPAEHVLSALGNDGLGPTFHATRYVQIGSMAGPTINLAAGILRSAGVTLTGVGFGSVPLDVVVRARTEFLPRLFGMLADGQLQLTTQARPLADVEAVWAQREPSGTRVVFTPRAC
ncbi:zinc-binding alcohol dehydrogenase family protein [Mycobacterium sp. pUA109]|uniref:zinc-binding alcohol dehydrogenase family protein n=1 Tax=Mycobacterium sp. pUA109 TaxID=3238982 RepID=UPI00351B054A